MKRNRRAQIIEHSWQKNKETGLTREQIEQYKKLSITEQSLNAIYTYSLSGFALSGYGLQLNLSAFQLSIVFASILLSQFTAPLSAWIGGRLDSHRNLIGFTRAVSSLLMIFMAIGGIVFGQFMDFGFFLIFMALSSIFNSISGALRCGLLDSAVPQDELQSFSTRRSWIVNVVGIISCISSGVLLQLLPKPMNFQLVILIGNLSNLLAVIPLKLQPETKAIRLERVGFIESYKFVFTDQRFKLLTRFLAIFYSGFLMIGNLIFIHLIRDLNFNFIECSIWALLGYISITYFSIRSAKMSGISQIKGVSFISILALIVLVPTLTILATPVFHFPIFLVAIIHSGCGAVINVLYNKLATNQIQPGDKAKVSAGLWLLVGTVSVPTLLLGGILLDIFGKVGFLKTNVVQLLPFGFVTLLGVLLIIISIPYLVRIFEASAKSIKYIVWYFISTAFRLGKEEENIATNKEFEKEKDGSTDNSKEEK